MSTVDLFLPCAGGCPPFLATEVQRLCAVPDHALTVGRAGVGLRGDWDTMLRLNLHSRIAQRVLLRLWEGPYPQRRRPLRRGCRNRLGGLVHATAYA
jgi:putative N6-adenine-specific DNA methylase